MNFFKLYIGDYQRDTAHLSVTEHGAYMLMLQHYYATEKPLPTGKALHRMLRAQDKEEREAIDSVASQFWTLTDAGLVNERADVEITKAASQGDTNARIAREREEKRRAAREANEQSTNRATNDQPNHSQTPDTREEKKNPPTPKGAGEGRFPEFWAAWPNTERKQDRKKCLAKWQRSRWDADADVIVTHVLAMRETRKWRDGFEPAPLTYLNGERWRDGVTVEAGGADIFAGAH